MILCSIFSVFWLIFHGLLLSGECTNYHTVLCVHNRHRLSTSQEEYTKWDITKDKDLWMWLQGYFWLFEERLGVFTKTMKKKKGNGIYKERGKNPRFSGNSLSFAKNGYITITSSKPPASKGKIYKYTFWVFVVSETVKCTWTHMHVTFLNTKNDTRTTTHIQQCSNALKWCVEPTHT